MICVLDPALTLVRCNNKVFLAVFQVLGIRHGTVDVQSLPSRFLNEPNVHIHGQIMKLGLINGTPEPDQPDWKWNGGFETRSKGSLGYVHFFSPLSLLFFNTGIKLRACYG